MIKLPTTEEMLKAGMHFGHRTSKWHPKMKPYIFGARNGVHIIDLVKTQVKLEEALNFIQKTVASGKIFMMVGTKDQVKNRIKTIAVETGVPYVSEKWIGGTLTNFAIIRKMTKKYSDLLEKKKLGKLDKYTKKERLDFDREMARLEKSVGGLVTLMRNPDVLFVWDIKKEKTVIAEAIKKEIKIVAVCDTNVNPSGISYVIPANDDATKTIKMILGLIKEAVLEGKAQAGEKNGKAGNQEAAVGR